MPAPMPREAPVTIAVLPRRGSVELDAMLMVFSNEEFTLRDPYNLIL